MLYVLANSYPEGSETREVLSHLFIYHYRLSLSLYLIPSPLILLTLYPPHSLLSPSHHSSGIDKRGSVHEASTRNWPGEDWNSRWGPTCHRCLLCKQEILVCSFSPPFFFFLPFFLPFSSSLFLCDHFTIANIYLVFLAASLLAGTRYVQPSFLYSFHLLIISSSLFSFFISIFYIFLFLYLSIFYISFIYIYLSESSLEHSLHIMDGDHRSPLQPLLLGWCLELNLLIPRCFSTRLFPNNKQWY